MPDLAITVESAAPVPFAAAPMLGFRLRVTNSDRDEPIQTVFLRCQLQIEVTRRRYSPEDQARLHDLFGEPERWGRTLRNLHWMNTNIVIPRFAGATTAEPLIERSVSSFFVDSAGSLVAYEPTSTTSGNLVRFSFASDPSIYLEQGLPGSFSQMALDGSGNLVALTTSGCLERFAAGGVSPDVMIPDGVASFVVDVAGFASELVEKKLLGAVLGNHSDEGIGGLFRGELHAGNSALMRDDVDTGDAVGSLEKGSGDSGHIEDFEGTREDSKGFGMLGLSRVGFDDAVTQTTASALIGKKKTDGPGPDD